MEEKGKVPWSYLMEKDCGFEGILWGRHPGRQRGLPREDSLQGQHLGPLRGLPREGQATQYRLPWVIIPH